MYPTLADGHHRVGRGRFGLTRRAVCVAYRIAIEPFHGPLDLLLYLVKRQEVDIHEVSLSSVTEQFLEHLAIVQELDVELAGDFLVLAATLMEIKSRSLLPVEVAAAAPDAVPDPRRQLVRQLLDYRKYKDAATVLEQHASASAQRFPRTAPAETVVAANDDAMPHVRPVELWDLVSAFGRIMREHATTIEQHITIDDTPQETYERAILQLVQTHGRLAFAEVFTPPYSKAKLIGLFLAMLELIKRRLIDLDQLEPLGPIWLLRPAPALLDNS